MTSLLWVLLTPVLFIGPGLLLARLVAGPKISGITLAWAAFFSVVLLPTFAFGLAMLFGTTANALLVIPFALVLGILGLVFPRNKGEEKAG